MENICSVCYDNEFDKCMSFTFECNHRMCLDCLVKYQNKYNNCHICRNQIDYKIFELNGGKSTIFIKYCDKYIPIYNINFDIMTNEQLCTIIELKLNGTYNDIVRIIYSGVQLSSNNKTLNSNRIPPSDCSIVHCVMRLRGD